MLVVVPLFALALSALPSCDDDAPPAPDAAAADDSPVCSPACGPSETCCFQSEVVGGYECRDLQTSFTACGACNTTCSVMAHCVGGECVE